MTIQTFFHSSGQISAYRHITTSTTASGSPDCSQLLVVADVDLWSSTPDTIFSLQHLSQRMPLTPGEVHGRLAALGGGSGNQTVLHALFVRYEDTLVTHRARDFEHGIHKNLLKNSAEPSGTTSPVKTLLSNGLKSAASENKLGTVPPEKGLVLLDECVAGLGEDADQIFHFQGVEGRHDRQTAKELGD